METSIKHSGDKLYVVTKWLEDVDVDPIVWKEFSVHGTYQSLDEAKTKIHAAADEAIAKQIAEFPNELWEPVQKDEGGGKIRVHDPNEHNTVVASLMAKTRVDGGLHSVRVCVEVVEFPKDTEVGRSLFSTHHDCAQAIDYYFNGEPLPLVVGE